MPAEGAEHSAGRPNGSPEGERNSRSLAYQTNCFHRAFSKNGGIGYLALDKHVKEILVGLSAVGVGHQVAEHRLVAVLVEPETRQASACCRRLLQPPALGSGHVCGL